jgi:AcrR family transcriptional regulator
MSPPPRTKAHHRARGPGRPPGDSACQRERLLEAALACYARDGIAATSVRQIATEAGVTPALVNYYFGSKSRLLEAVVQERLLPVVAGLRRGVEAAGNDPRALAEGFVRAMHAAVERHPWLPSLWVREILSEGGALRELLFERIGPLVAKLLAEKLSAAQRRGDLSANIEPRLLVVSLIGLTLYPLAATTIWRRLFSAEDVDAKTLLHHSLALLQQGLGGAHAR